MRDVDLSAVTYRPDLELLAALFASLAEAGEALRLHLLVQDNSPEATVADAVDALARRSGAAFATVDVQRSGKNLGFGRGHNANAARAKSPWLLVVNQDCILEPGALAALVAIADGDDASVAAWEMRQIPYEHPKAYDPVTLDVPWVSGAATLFRRAAYDAVAGFDDAIFMYGEDVDLSWRLRARGWRLSYQPKCAVVHRTYREAAEVKPLQVCGGVQTNLGLRMRFGGVARMLQGFAMLAAEVLAPQTFPGRRTGLLKAGWRALVRAPHFLASRPQASPTFRPVFSGWGYEVRRDGAFQEFRSRRERPHDPLPKVSVLIRTIDRPAWLRQALGSCANQTHANLEVVVVEDGPPASAAVIEEFRDRLDIRYEATGSKVGRARAGNRALALSTGEWLNFLDDDDVFFADHVEVLLRAAEEAGTKGAYGLAWETHTQIRDRQHAEYDETMHATAHRQPFDRLVLWHHNYLPIQAVLFHRSLYARHGGFAEDMDQLEDWNLWTRYTLEDDFVLVEKTTSKYRVPADMQDAAGRQALLDRAYADARLRQESLRLTLSPRAISEMAEAYARSQALMMVTRDDMRRFVGGSGLAARVASWRRPVVGLLRRRGWLR